MKHITVAVGLILLLASMFCPHGIFIVLAGFGGGLIICAILFGEERRLVKLVSLALMLSAVAPIWLAVSYTKHPVVTAYPIYHATAPYGVLWREVKGSAVFVFIVGFGEADTQLRETYIIKYLDGQTLCTMNLDASKTGVVIDGKFELDVVKTYYRYSHWLWGTIANPESSELSYVIHLPRLPTANGTTVGFQLLP